MNISMLIKPFFEVWRDGFRIDSAIPFLMFFLFVLRFLMKNIFFRFSIVHFFDGFDGKTVLRDGVDKEANQHHNDFLDST